MNKNRVRSFPAVLLFLLPVFVLALILGLLEYRSIRAAFEKDFQERSFLIEKSLGFLSFTLQTGVSFIESSESLNESLFSRFTAPFLEKLPGITSFNWSLYHPTNPVVTYSRASKAGINLKGQPLSGVAAFQTSRYSSLQPGEILSTLISSDPGNPASASRLSLMTPCYRNGRIVGFLLIRVSPSLLIEDSVKELKPQPIDIELSMKSEKIALKLPVYSSKRIHSIAIEKISHRFLSANREYDITSCLTYAYYFKHKTWVSEIFLLAGLLLCLLLFIIWKRAREENSRIQGLVDIRTRELQESKDRFQSIFDSINDAVFIQDFKDGRILDVNDTMCRMYGYTREEVLRMDIPALSSNEAPYSFEEAFKHWDEVRQSGHPQCFDWRAKRKDGSLFWVELNMRRSLLEGQEVLLVTARDISERIEAGKENRAIIENAPFGSHSYELQADGRLVFTGGNPAADRILGLDHSKLIGKTIEEAFPGLANTEIPEIYRLAAMAGKSYETDQVTYDRGEVRGAFEIHAFQTTPGHMTVFFLNITERKKAEHLLNLTLEETRMRLELSAALGNVDTEDEVIEIMIDKTRVIKHMSCAISLFTDESRTAVVLKRVRAAEGLEVRTPEGSVYSADLYPGLKRLQNKEPVIIEDTSTDQILDEETRQLNLRSGTQSLVIIPLLAGTEFLGFIHFSSLTPQTFSPLEISFYQTIADIGGNALRVARLRQSIRESQQRLELLVNSSPLGLIEWDMEFRIKTWTPSAERIFGYTQAEAIGKQAYELIVPEKFRADVNVVWAKLVTQKKETRSINQNLRKDGQLITCEWFNTPLIGTDGRQIGVTSLIEDITEKKQIEEDLKREQTVTQAILRSVPGLLYLYDVEGHLLRWNKAHETLTGYSAEELSRMTLMDWYKDSPEDINSISAGVEKAFQNGYAEADGNLQTKSGKRIPFHFNAVYLEIDGKPYIVGIGIDMTEILKATEEIKRLNAELEGRVEERTAQLASANKELEAFAYSVSHDLRAPLRAIDGFSRILAEDYSSLLGQEGQRVCGVIQDNTRRMNQLIDDILSFSRLGRTEMNFGTVHMTTLAQTVYEELDRLKPNPDRRWVLNDLPDTFGDQTMIRQIWVNLISNAIKYSSKVENPVIEVGFIEKDGKRAYYVKDNGAGFDMKYAGKLFGVFQRLHSEKDFEGTGVGLALVQRIISRHGGSIWAEAEVGKGATFYFTLPGKKS